MYMYTGIINYNCAKPGFTLGHRYTRLITFRRWADFEDTEDYKIGIFPNLSDYYRCVVLSSLIFNRLWTDMKMIIVRDILQPTCPTLFIYLLLLNSDDRRLHSIAKYTIYESFRNLTIITLMCGLCEKSINWNYPHYPVVSDGLVFIKILTKAINVHTRHKIHAR